VARTPKQQPALLEVESLDELERQERSISSARRRLHDVIDFLRGLNVPAHSPEREQLQHLQHKEQELSKRRRVLHGVIDALRAGKN
jgi:hypothetical protein